MKEHQALFTNIADLISQAEAWANAIPLSIHNVKSFESAVLARELLREVNFLKKIILKDIDEACADFKARCLKRATSPKNSLSFAENPDTQTNRLYFSIAILLFNPRDLKTVLTILMPPITHCVLITVPDLPAGRTLAERKALHDAANPIIETHELTYLENIAVENAHLEMCVFSENTVIFLPETDLVKPLTFQWHRKCYDALTEAYPALAARVYQHNIDFQILTDDIALRTNNITPTVLIQQFIWGLKSGGRNYTGREEEAAISALNAVVRFFNLFNQFPEDMRNQLLMLTSLEGITLNNILGRLTDKRQHSASCVESAASDLFSLLSAQKNSALLNTNIVLGTTASTGQVAYASKVLSANRNTQQSHAYPLNIIKNVVRNISISSAEVLVLTLKNTPTEFYAAFLKHAEITLDALNELAYALEDALFTQTEERAILHAGLNSHKLSIKIKKTCLAVINKLTDNERDDLFRSFTRVSQVRRYAQIKNTDISTDFIQRLSLNMQKTVMRSVLDFNNPKSLFHHVCLESFIKLYHNYLNIFDEPEQTHLVATLKNTLLNTQSYDEFQKLARLGFNLADLKDEHNRNILHHLAHAEKDPTKLIANIPLTATTEQIMEMFLTTDSAGNIPLYATQNPVNFRSILHLIGKDKFLNFILDKNKRLVPYLQTVFSDENNTAAPKQIAFILCIASTLSKPDLISFLNAKTSNKERVIDCLLKNKTEALNLTKVYNTNNMSLHQDFAWILTLINSRCVQPGAITQVIRELVTHCASLAEIRINLSLRLVEYFLTANLFTPKTVNNIKRKFNFYKQYNIKLQASDYVKLIKYYLPIDTTLTTICAKEFVSQQLRELGVGIFLIPGLDILSLIIQDSFKKTQDQHYLFKPTFLFKINALIKAEDQIVWRNLSVNIPALSLDQVVISELLEGQFYYLRETLDTSPHLMARILQYLYGKEVYTQTLIKNAILTDIQFTDSQRAPSMVKTNTNLKKLIFSKPTLYQWPEYLVAILNDAFRLYSQCRDINIEKKQLLKFARHVFKPLNPVQRLTVLRYTPFGESKSLLEILTPEIKAMIAKKIKFERALEGNIANFEEWLLFTNSKTSDIFDDLLNYPNVYYSNSRIRARIEHLLITRTHECQTLCEKQHLLEKYLKNANYPSTRLIVLMMRLYPIHRLNMTQSALNSALQTLVMYEPGNQVIAFERLNMQTILNAITQLVAMGADINAPDKNGFPPIISTKNLIMLEHLIQLGANLYTIARFEYCVLTHAINEFTREPSTHADALHKLLDLLFKHNFDIRRYDDQIAGSILGNKTPLAALVNSRLDLGISRISSTQYLYVSITSEYLTKYSYIARVIERFIEAGSNLYVDFDTKPLIDTLITLYPNHPIILQHATKQFSQTMIRIRQFYDLLHALNKLTQFNSGHPIPDTMRGELHTLLKKPVKLKSYHALKTRFTELFSTLITPDDKGDFDFSLVAFASKSTDALINTLLTSLFHFYRIHTQADLIRVLMPSVRTVVTFQDARQSIIIESSPDEIYIQAAQPTRASIQFLNNLYAHDGKLVERTSRGDIPDCFIDTYVTIPRLTAQSSATLFNQPHSTNKETPRNLSTSLRK